MPLAISKPNVSTSTCEAETRWVAGDASEGQNMEKQAMKKLRTTAKTIEKAIKVMNEQLLGCPFCGSSDSLEVRRMQFPDIDLHQEYSEYRVVCSPSLASRRSRGLPSGCDVEGPVASERHKAIYLWNRRAAIKPRRKKR